MRDSKNQNVNNLNKMNGVPSHSSRDLGPHTLLLSYLLLSLPIVALKEAGGGWFAHHTTFWPSTIVNQYLILWGNQSPRRKTTCHKFSIITTLPSLSTHFTINKSLYTLFITDQCDFTLLQCYPLASNYCNARSGLHSLEYVSRCTSPRISPPRRNIPEVKVG